MDQWLNDIFKPAVEFLDKIIFWDIAETLGFNLETKVPFVVVWLFLGGLFFTIRLRYINFRGIKHGVKILTGVFSKKGDTGEVTHFQALTTALSATVGLGNIAGVAIAISLGGPGATFWMILAGLLGMSLKFVECTLGVKYRKILPDGSVAGGPMYYLSRGLESKGLKKLGITLAIVYSVLIVLASFGGGNMFQSNQAIAQLNSVVPFLEKYSVITGILLALLVGVVIIGGIKSIARVTSRIVPFMALLYIGASVVIIFSNYDRILEVLLLILKSAFSVNAAAGGIAGVFVVGFQRGAFSNEAGIGSASIAHSAAKTNQPIREGYVGLLEPFIDTVVICSMTALLIIFTGVYENSGDLSGAPLTSKAFSTVFPWFPYLLVMAIFLFAFSTLLSWSYYGLKGFNYLFAGIIGRKTSSLIYQVVFLFFIVLGSATELKDVIDFSDMMILGCAFPNLIGLYIFVPDVIAELKAYHLKSNA
jgi:AGCS family alanine or glycine:cation symporter